MTICLNVASLSILTKAFVAALRNDWKGGQYEGCAYCCSNSLLHTSGSYVYMETSWQKGSGQTAFLVSPPLPASRARCMQFYYHMYGDTMGSLNVYIQNPVTKVKSRVFTKSGDQGNTWHLGKVTIATTCKHQVCESFRCGLPCKMS